MQLFILAQLSESNGLRFSDLKPGRMEPGQFMYHMNKLLEAGLVTKAGGSYHLGDQGIRFIDQFNLENLQPFSYPRLTVSLLYLSSDKGCLLSEINRQPLLGEIGLIVRDVPLELNDSLATFAASSFKEASGKTVEFIHIADGYIKLVDSGKVIANMLTQVMLAKGPSFEPLDDSLIWQATLNKDKKLYPSTEYVLKMLDRQLIDPFFELSIDYLSR